MSEASITNTIYSATVIKMDGTTYHVTDIITDLMVSHGKDELAEKAVISLMNVKTGGSDIKKLISLGDYVCVYADAGNGKEEVMRGTIWKRDLSEDSGEDIIRLTCYDDLIYFHKSKDNFFAKKGKTTESIIKSISDKWGISVDYKYTSIIHGKFAFHNESIADIFVTVLDEAKKQTGADYVIRSEKGVIVIDFAGSNSQAYIVDENSNAISSNYSESMDNMVTQVLIVKAETVSKDGGEEESGKYLTVTRVDKNTDEYGTLQEVLVKGKDQALSEVQKQADETLKEKSTPEIESEFTAIDNPYIKKGHQIYARTSNISGFCTVLAIEHDAMKNIMSLEVKKL